MIRVALCDDDIFTLNEMERFLDRYCRERNREIVHTTFCSPLELLTEIEQGVRFDVLFLDILMPGQNGIETAAEIRSYDSNIKIIFLTFSAEFAVQSYTVEAYFYQLKPLQWEGFSQVMDSVPFASVDPALRPYREASVASDLHPVRLLVLPDAALAGAFGGDSAAGGGYDAKAG